jgi:3-oxoacyl-[acyl-carrier protein] reductase
MTTGPSPPPYPSSHSLLDGKTVVITAAAGAGIGFATAKRCIEEGAIVAISDQHERRLGEAADQLAAINGTAPLAVPCDVTNEDEVQRLFDTAAVELGRIDVAVNNAGLGGTAPITEMTDEQWYAVLEVTLTGRGKRTTPRRRPA